MLSIAGEGDAQSDCDLQILEYMSECIPVRESGYVKMLRQYVDGVRQVSSSANGQLDQ